MGRAIFGLVLFAASATLAQAYTPTMTETGKAVRWNSQPKINFAGNSSNQNGLDPGNVFSAVVTSLQRWQRASNGAVTFDYWQGTDPGIYEPNSNYNGLSSIYFSSNVRGANFLSANVLGLTQVWYNTDTGDILETDIVLNDRDFRFTLDPRDTSGFGSSSGPGGRGSVYIQNVLTHEMGHAYGLSHSGGLQATMLFMESPEQAHLGCDETVGIHALYPAGDQSSRGSIVGSVSLDRGGAVFGAHVSAISRQRGTVLASAMTDPSGNYRISALEPGDYFLMVEPFFAGASALPAYYNDINPAVCPGRVEFSRSMLTTAGTSRPQTVRVNPNSNTSAPQLVAHCGSSNGALVYSDPNATRASSAPQIYDGARDRNGFGVFDRMSPSGPSYYRLTSISGRIEVHAIGYSLYSPVSLSLTLADAGGSPVNAQMISPVYVGDSGYSNYDASLVADGLPPGDYYVRVTSRSLDVSRFPAGQIAIDTVPFVLLAGSVNEGAPPLANSIPVNARCRMDERFAGYSSPGGNPPRNQVEQEEEDGGGWFCGTIDISNRPKGGGSGPSPASIAGWFLPWATMMVALRMMRRRVVHGKVAPLA